MSQKLKSLLVEYIDKKGGVLTIDVEDLTSFLSAHNVMVVKKAYWFGMYILGGEIRYRWICKKCDYVFDIDAGHLRDMLSFVKGHVCIER